jgi:CRP-like cAMP-binding protein
MTSIELPELPDDKARELRAISHYRRYTKQESVFRDGDKYVGPFIVAEGQFKIFMMGDGGKETIMHIFREGELVGGGPLFLGGDYPASCAALADGCLVSFEYDRLKKLITSDRTIHGFFAQRSIRLMPFLKEKIENATLKNAETRILDYLRSMGADRGPVELDVPKNQIAALLDLTPESVSRVFAQLVARNVLIAGDKTYQIK